MIEITAFRDLQAPTEIMAGLATQLAVDADGTDRIATIVTETILDQGDISGMGCPLGAQLIEQIADRWRSTA